MARRVVPQKKRRSNDSKRKQKPAKPARLSIMDERGRQRRDERGRILSREDWKLRRKEIQRRLADKQERQAELERLRAVRAKEVKALRRARHKQTHEPKKDGGQLKYKYKLTPWNKLALRGKLARDEVISATGNIPAPHEVNKAGAYYLTVWRWWDGDNVDYVGRFLLALKERFGAQTLGRVAIGSDYSMSGVWVGTATLPLGGAKDLWWSYQRLLATVSGRDVVGDVSQARNDVWIEVELLLREDIR